jgi:hypothetical protein
MTVTVGPVLAEHRFQVNRRLLLKRVSHICDVAGGSPDG